MKSVSVITAMLLLSLSFSVGASAQSTVGTLTGTVSDNTNAKLPGVLVKVLNEDTGQGQSLLTNDSGSYSFILSPGSNYTVTTEFTGFKQVTVNKIILRIGDTTTVNVTLEVGDIVQKIIVDATKADPLLKDPTIGITLGETEIMGLPLVGNDPLQLITTLPGYRANPLGHEYDTVGGLPMSMINTVRDGLSVTDGFTPNGVGSTTILNPDMISEIRLILSPVDAESGRGNGQVQITTKSGTNKFQWNINYNLRQNAFNSLGPSPSRIKQPFAATFQYIVSVGGPIWKNHTFYFVNWDQQLTYRRPFSQRPACTGFDACAAGGYTVVPALTEPAKDGVFRFFDGWNLSNAVTPANPAAGTVAWPIDISGNAVAPPIWAGTNEPYDGQLMCFSVFGTRTRSKTTFGDEDCGQYYLRKSDGTPDFDNPRQGKAIFPSITDPYTGELSWDGHGRVPDRTGYMDRLLAYMPKANYFGSGATSGGQVSSLGADGLNRASASYILETKGLANRNTFAGGTFGTGLALDQANVDHKVVNIKLDHNISSMHRVTFSTSFQNDRNSRPGAFSRWPDGVDGYSTRGPHVLTLNGLSTISPTMVNEARFGISYNKSAQLPPWFNPEDQGSADFAKSFLQEGWNSVGSGDPTPIYYTPGIGTFLDFNSNILPSGLNSSVRTSGIGTTTPPLGGFDVTAGCLNAGYVSTASCSTGSALYNFADTFSWNVRSHAFRAGGELRLTRAHEVLSTVIPSATAGSATATAARLGDAIYPGDLPAFSQTAGGRFTGLMTTSRNNARDLLYFLSGSVLSVNQQYWVNSVDNYRYGKWDTWDGSYCPEEGDLEKFCPGEGKQARDTVQNEFALFLKDDWKITRTLTLNLGVRYESYGNLYTRGFATGILDAGYGLFGPTRARNFSTAGYEPFDYNYDPFATWMTPGTTYRTGYGTTPPTINVAGTFLPNGACNYIPGLSTSTVNDRNPDGTCASTVPTSSVGGSSYLMTNACVYGVQQNTLLPVSNCQPNLLTTRVFVGPDSVPHGDPTAPDYSKKPSTYRDRNNIGPAIGFSWRPTLGKRVVLVRGGFQFTYGSAGRDRSFATGTASTLTNRSGGSNINATADQLTVTCGSATAVCSGIPAGLAFLLSDLPTLAPSALAPTSVPTLGANTNGVAGSSGNINPTGANLLSLPVLNNSTGNNITGYSPRYQDARTENYTFSVSTNLNRSSSVSVSYVGTLGRNRPTSVDINTVNVFGKNPDGSWANEELLQALVDARAGKESPFLDSVLAGLNFAPAANVAGFGPIGTCVALAGANPGVNSGGPDNNYCGPGFVYQSASSHLRRNLFTRVNLANGNFNAVVDSLMRNTQFQGTIGAPVAPNVLSNNTLFPTSFSGMPFRNGCDRLGTASLAGLSGRQFVRGSAAAGTGNTNGALGGNPDTVRCLPEDFVIANSTIDKATYLDNWGYTNYHQLQAQYTLRMSTGISVQATYLTSKTLALPRDFYRTNSYNYNASGGNYASSAYSPGLTGFSNPQSEESRRLDYALSSDSLAHSVRLNAVLSLPIGPGRALFGKTHGIIGRLVGGWTMSVIYNAQSGTPFSISGGDMLYGDSSGNAAPSDESTGGGCNAYSGTAFSPNTTGADLQCASGLGFPDVVSPLWTNPRGRLKVNGPAGETTYFGSPSPFAVIKDPQCTNGQYVAVNPKTDVGTIVGNFDYAGQCSLRAMVMRVPEGTPGAFPLGPALPTPTNDTTPVLIMLQNPTPGRNGSLGAQTMRQPSRFYLDSSLAKTFMFTERRGVQLRVDATNVLNHPQPIDIYMSLGPGGSVSDSSTASLRALANGCFNQYSASSTLGNANVLQNGLANCGRQVQVSFRMINN